MQRSTAEQQLTQLQQCDPEAWTTILRRNVDHPWLRVTGVETEAMGVAGTRYLLTLADHSDPITLLGRTASQREVDFHQQLNPHIAFLAPHCWFSYRGDPEGWVVLDDVPHDRPTDVWSKADALDIMRDLAEYHGDFWNRHELLHDKKWLPYYIGRIDPTLHTPIRPAATDWDKTTLSQQAINSTHGIAAQWQEAAEGVRLMMELGSWNGVLDERHLRAAADLIDDPLPILHHLRNLPVTLLHGYPGIYNWRVSGLGARHLVDWRNVSVGPAVCDLVTVLETFGLLRDEKYLWRLRSTWPVTEETLIDTYILTLTNTLGSKCDGRALRRAIPAARCLFIMLNWFPRFGHWLNKLPDNPAARRDIWRVINQDNNDPEAAAAYQPILSLRPYLAQTFHRFIRSYYQL